MTELQTLSKNICPNDPTNKYNFETILKVSLHEKTAKAIRSKRGEIQKILHGLSCNAKYLELQKIVALILGISGARCCYCNKSLGKKERKQCDGCNRMTYCSEACQKEDWEKGGHNLACNKAYAKQQLGQFQGTMLPKRVPGSQRAAAKLKELEMNLAMIQLNMFLGNIDVLMRRARNLKLPLYDCVIAFDLRECPLVIDVKSYKTYYQPIERKRFEASRSKKNINCIYLAYNYSGNNEVDRELCMQRLFPSNVCQAGITPKHLFLEERQLKTKIIQKLLHPAKNRLSGSNHKRDSRPAPVPPPPQQHTAGQLPVLPLHLELELPPWAFDRRISRSSNTE